MKFTLSVLGVIAILPPVYGELRAARCEAIEVGKGKYLFVMLDKVLRKDHPLSKIYSESGLYHNNRSREPIWTVPYEFRGEVFLSSDGDCLAHIVFPAPSDADGMRFFKRGNLIRAYKVSELTRLESIDAGNKCPGCIWHQNIAFNEPEGAIYVECKDGKRWRFNLSTGDGIVQHDPGFAKKVTQKDGTVDAVETSEAMTQENSDRAKWWIAAGMGVALCLLVLYFGGVFRGHGTT